MRQESIHDQGFALIPNVLAQADVAQLMEWLAQVPLRRSRAGVRHLLANPAVSDLARDSRLMQIARSVLGDDAFPYRATLFDKSPKANWLVVWHQDTALPLRNRRDLPGWGPWSVKESVLYAHAPESALAQVLALRVHLDDSTEQNGPLRVLPATHTLGVLNDDLIHHLATQKVAVECAVLSGGIAAMRPLLVHASSKSQIHAPRRVLHIEYAASPVIADGLELAVA